MASPWGTVMEAMGDSLASCQGYSRPSPQHGTYVPPSNGISGGYTGNNQTILQAMTAFSAVAWYNSIEIIFMVLFRFKKHEGLYFWSLLVTAFATIVYQIGSWGNMFQIAGKCYPDILIMVTFQNIGWIFMVTGQSLVLYSRLHIIVINNHKLLRFVLWMILVDAVVLYVPTTTLNYGTVVNMTEAYTTGYNTMERIQMTLFSLQEFVISGVYLWEVRKFIKGWGEDTRKLMIELIAVNIALILLDVALLSVEFENLYMIETTLKGMVYSIKLKLEIGVLSKMVKVVETRKKSRMMPDLEEDIDPRKFSSTATYDQCFAERPTRQTSGSSDSSPFRKSAAQDTEHIERAQNAENDALQLPQDHNSEFRSARPEMSRQSSIQDLYPGRIQGSDENATT